MRGPRLQGAKLDAGARRPQSPVMGEDIESVIEVAAPRPLVWQAATHPAFVPKWMGCLRFARLAGHVFYLQPDRARRAQDDVTDAIACRIESLDEPRRFSFRWAFPDTPETFVELRLREISGGTHVKLTHSGWEQFDPEETREVREGLARAWHAVALPRLRQVAESLSP